MNILLRLRLLLNLDELVTIIHKFLRKNQSMNFILQVKDQTDSKPQNLHNLHYFRE